jgi:hypothetical protein
MEPITEASSPSAAPAVPAPAELLTRDGRDALRIQAAAVAAQQAALTEEEIRQRQKQLALQQQEEQLAAHLEEKRRRLLALRDAVRAEHKTLIKEREAFKQRVALAGQRLSQSQAEVDNTQEELQAERRRLISLRERLRKRFHRHWAVERAAIKMRETALQEQHLRLDRQAERMRQDDAELAQRRLRLNGEVELARRQMQAETAELRKSQEELQSRVRVLDQRRLELDRAAKALARDQRDWEEARVFLEREKNGLETRVARYREMLQQQQTELARRTATGNQTAARDQAEHISGLALAAAPCPGQSGGKSAGGQCEEQAPSELPRLQALAGELADQRLVLVEQCEELGRAQLSWRQSHEAITNDLEILAVRLNEREREICLRQEELRERDSELRRRDDESTEIHKRVVWERARLTTDKAEWEGEKERLLAELSLRERLVDDRVERLSRLRDGWNERRRRQFADLTARRNACEELRRECAILRKDLIERGSRLQHEQRALSERALAMERYRQQYLGKAVNPKIAEKRLEHFRRREAAHFAVAQRSLATERRELAAEAARLEQQTRLLHRQTQEVHLHEVELTHRQTIWEHQQMQAEEKQHKLENLLARLRQQTYSYHHQIDSLREQVERLGQALLEQSDGVSAPLDKAA